jgi:hypothetical protein
MEIDLPDVLDESGPSMQHVLNALHNWERSAEAVQQALETLANLFTILPANSLASFARASLPHLVHWSCLNVPQLDVKFGSRMLTLLPALDNALNHLQILQLRGLSCMNNLFIALDPEVMQTMPELRNVWTSLLSATRITAEALMAEPAKQEGQQQQQQQNLQEDDELLDALCQCAWALCRPLSSQPALPVTMDQINGLMTLLERRVSREAGVAVAGMLGSLCGYYARANANAAVFARAAQLLITCGSTQGVPAALTAECLNSTIDLFSDDGTHNVFVKHNVGSAIASKLLPAAEAALQAAEAEEREHLQEVIENARAFLDYKKGQ